MTEMLSVQCRVEGRVQGVWFRAWTVEEAAKRGLSGWVRNRRDGSVEALFAGPADKVREMVALCWQGPPAARVTAVTESFTAPPHCDGFEQLPTW